MSIDIQYIGSHAMIMPVLGSAGTVIRAREAEQICLHLENSLTDVGAFCNCDQKQVQYMSERFLSMVERKLPILYSR